MGTIEIEVEKEYFFYNPNTKKYYNEFWTRHQYLWKRVYDHVEILREDT